MPDFKIATIDEYLIIDLRTGKKRWVTLMPHNLKAYECVIHIKGKVKIPAWLPTIDVGEISMPEVEASAQAEMR